MTTGNKLLDWIAAVSDYETGIGPDPDTLPQFKGFDPYAGFLRMEAQWSKASPDDEAHEDAEFSASATASRQDRCDRLLEQGVTDLSTLGAELNCTRRYAAVLLCRSRKNQRETKAHARRARRLAQPPKHEPVKIKWQS